MADDSDADQESRYSPAQMVLMWILFIPFAIVTGWLGYRMITSDVSCPKYGELCRVPAEQFIESVEQFDTSTPAGRTRTDAKSYEIKWTNEQGNYTEAEEDEILSGRNMPLIEFLNTLTDQGLDKFAAARCEALASADSADEYRESIRMGKGAYLIGLEATEAAVPNYCPENSAMLAEVVALG